MLPFLPRGVPRAGIDVRNVENHPERMTEIDLNMLASQWGRDPALPRGRWELEKLGDGELPWPGWQLRSQSAEQAINGRYWRFHPDTVVGQDTAQHLQEPNSTTRESNSMIHVEIGLQAGPALPAKGSRLFPWNV
jgi:hypothetical protein